MQHGNYVQITPYLRQSSLKATSSLLNFYFTLPKDFTLYVTFQIKNVQNNDDPSLFLSHLRHPYGPNFLRRHRQPNLLRLHRHVHLCKLFAGQILSWLRIRDQPQVPSVFPRHLHRPQPLQQPHCSLR